MKAPIRRAALAAALGLVAPLTAPAAITFDFEEQTVDILPGFSSLVSLQGGVTVTITNGNGNNLQVWDLTPFGRPASWLSRTIGNNLPDFGTIIFNFDQDVSDVSIEFGDYDRDDDETVSLEAFSGADGTGVSLGSDSVSYPAGLDIGLNPETDFRTLSIVGGGIRSLVFTGGGSGPGSLFVDNLVVNTATAVPEPSTLAMAGLASLAGLGVAWRRRKRA
jgi:hypothetical protein